MELHEALDRVDGPTSFIEFVEHLIADRQEEQDDQVDMFGRGPNGWENHSIEDFLEAAVRWAKDSRFGRDQGLESVSPWKQFAEFLYCGKIYE